MCATTPSPLICNVEAVDVSWLGLMWICGLFHRGQLGRRDSALERDRCWEATGREGLCPQGTGVEGVPHRRGLTLSTRQVLSLRCAGTTIPFSRGNRGQMLFVRELPNVSVLRSALRSSRKRRPNQNWAERAGLAGGLQLAMGQRVRGVEAPGECGYELGLAQILPSQYSPVRAPTVHSASPTKPKAKA